MTHSIRNQGRPWRVAIAALALLALLAAGCSDDDDAAVAAEQDPTATTAPTEPPEPTPTEPPAPTATEIPDPTATPIPAAPSTCGNSLTSGVNEITLTTAGVTYDIRVYVPAGAPDSELLPTMLVWHGLTLDGPTIAAYTGFESLADTEGFLAVFPTGHPAPDDPILSFGNGWEMPDWRDSEAKDDVAFAADLLDELEANWCADPQRIYSAGDSNGGFFTSIMVCELAARIAAAASNSGVVHPESCAPSRAVPYIAIHGTADPVVPFETGGESIFGPGAAPPLGMRETFDQFVSDFGCNPEPAATGIGDDTTRYDYTGCNDDVPLSFYVIDGDGHTWPGSIGLNEETTDDIAATTEIWNFFDGRSL